MQGIVLPIVGGEDGIPHAPWEQLVDVQEGCVEKEGACCAQLPTHVKASTGLDSTTCTKSELVAST